MFEVDDATGATAQSREGDGGVGGGEVGDAVALKEGTRAFTEKRKPRWTGR